jgi:general secretion pathway protein G
MRALHLRSPDGYTYVELLLVVTVASVLTALAMPMGLTVHRVWEERQLKRALSQIRRAIDEYHADWEQGCIESKNEWGWPESVEELSTDKELGDAPHCQPPAPPAPAGSAELGGAGPSRNVPMRRGPGQDEAKPTKKYLKRIPQDPFNRHGDEWDVSGWKARAYDDEPDAKSWGGEGVYDVYSGSSLTALDGSLYEDW